MYFDAVQTGWHIKADGLLPQRRGAVVIDGLARAVDAHLHQAARTALPTDQCETAALKLEAEARIVAIAVSIRPTRRLRGVGRNPCAVIGDCGMVLLIGSRAQDIRDWRISCRRSRRS